MKKLHKVLFVTAALLTFVFFVGCSQAQDTQPQAPTESTAEAQQEEAAQESVPDEKETVNIALLKGPTGIGAVKLMEDSAQGLTENAYEIQICATPDEIVSKISSGEVDIAAAPTNLAATLYQKTQGQVQMAALNTLGVLYLLENGNTISSIEDLEGKTITATGQGATPEYVLQFILEQQGVQANVEYMTEHAELATAMASGNVLIGMLPEPNVTALLMKNPDIRIALDITEEWTNAVEGTEYEKSVLSMGCIIVNKDFAVSQKAAFDSFLEEYEKSVQYVNENVSQAAQLVEKYEIMSSAQAAEQAIPNCNIVYVDGEEMEQSITDFFQVLFDANPKSIGGEMPGEDFYYKK